MKFKNSILLISLFKIVFIYSQISATLPTVTFPHPSASGLMLLASNPVDYHTGFPDISIGLAQLETYSDKVGVNLSLVYHTTGLSLLNKVGDNGMGWNMSAGGSISKIVHNDPDYRNNTHIFHTTDDDVFVYNFMGYTGHFAIRKNTDGTYMLEYLTPTTLKIEFVMNNNSSSTTGITFDEVDYFTIYDDYGQLYKFDVYDTKTAIFKSNFIINSGTYTPFYDYYGNLLNPFDSGQLIGGKYRPTYHLSVIKDTNNKTLLEFEYEEFLINVNPYSSTTALQKENKLKTILSPGHGKIEFDYTYYPNAPREYLDNPNSYFKLNSLQLKNYKNSLIKKFEFVYDTFSVNYNYELGTTTNLSRRILTEVKEYTNDLSSSVSTFLFYNHPSNNATPNSNCSDFDYGRDGSGYLNLKSKNYPVVESSYPNDMIPEFGLFYTEPSMVTTGALSKIVYPTGGSVLYEFESNTFCATYNETAYTPEHIYFNSIEHEQYDHNPFNENITTFNSFVFNTAIINSFTFTVTGTTPKSLYFDFDDVPFYSQIHVDPNEALIPNYTLTGPNGFTYDFGVLSTSTTYFPCLGKRVSLAPGTYTIHINTYYSDASTTGQIFIHEKTPNYPLQEYFYGGGLRIKKIGTFKSAIANFFNGNNDDLVNYKEFVYTDFDNPNKSSCNPNLPFASYPDFHDYTIGFLGSHTYNNVKVIYGKNQELGYEKFTYLKFNELPLNPTNKKLYRNLYYQFNNGFLKKHEVFSQSNAKLKEIENGYSYLVDPNFFTWIFPATQYTKDYYYPNGSTVPSIKQTNQLFTYNSLNKNISESTLVNSLGESLTTKNFYHTGNTIYSKNRISEIERVETYKGTELLSKTQINYATLWLLNVSFLPNVIVSSKGDNALQSKMVITKYDEFSNPLQMNQENGIPISYIWGYNSSLPVAKIENLVHSSIPANLIQDIQNYSSTGTESQLLGALTALRNHSSLSGAMLTTYTYLPSIGISTVTDPKGFKMTFFYDKFNRLEKVTDHNNKILSESEYHYRTQN